MSCTFTLDVPGDASLWEQIRAEMGEATPPGLVVHIVQARPGGLRYIDVWEDEASWEAHRTGVLEPAVTRVLERHGIPHDTSLATFSPIEVVDVQVAAA